jgi:hypothetical protein
MFLKYFIFLVLIPPLLLFPWHSWSTCLKHPFRSFYPKVQHNQQRTPTPWHSWSTCLKHHVTLTCTTSTNTLQIQIINSSLCLLSFFLAYCRPFYYYWDELIIGPREVTRNWQIASKLPVVKKSVIYRVPTHPGKREIPGNFVLHVIGREMSLKIKKMVKIRDLPWKSLIKLK